MNVGPQRGLKPCSPGVDFTGTCELLSIVLGTELRHSLRIMCAVNS